MQAMKYWVKTKAIFRKSSEVSAELSKIIGNDIHESDDFKFDVREVLAFNRSDNPNYSCLRMKSGFDITIAIDFEDFEAIHEEILKDDKS